MRSHRHGLSAPVYSTLPVRRMGELFVTEMLLSKQVCRFTVPFVDLFLEAFSETSSESILQH